MKTLFALLFLTLLLACTESTEPSTVETFDVAIEDNLDLKTRAKRHVEASLQIPSTEKYDLQIFEKQCNDDVVLDAVILVNRKNKAYMDAELAQNTPQRAQTDFLGMYNYVFFFDGKNKKITRPIPIGSSAIYPLSIRFSHIFSEEYFDFTIEHRIRDAGYFSVFSVRQNTPIMVFQWKNFDNLKSDQPESLYFAYGEGKISAAKDILVFEGKFKEKPNPMDIGLGEKIEKTDKLLYRFYYNPSSGKYATDDKPKE